MLESDQLHLLASGHSSVTLEDCSFRIGAWFWLTALCPPGTLFLWIFWPAINSALLEGTKKRNAVFNTYYALAVSAVTATSMSALSHPQGKINMVRRKAASWAAHGSLCITPTFLDLTQLARLWVRMLQ